MSRRLSEKVLHCSFLFDRFGSSFFLMDGLSRRYNNFHSSISKTIIQELNRLIGFSLRYHIRRERTSKRRGVLTYQRSDRKSPFMSEDRISDICLLIDDILSCLSSGPKEYTQDNK